MIFTCFLLDTFFRVRVFLPVFKKTRPCRLCALRSGRPVSGCGRGFGVAASVPCVAASSPFTPQRSDGGLLAGNPSALSALFSGPPRQCKRALPCDFRLSRWKGDRGAALWRGPSSGASRSAASCFPFSPVTAPAPVRSAQDGEEQLQAPGPRRRGLARARPPGVRSQAAPRLRPGAEEGPVMAPLRPSRAPALDKPALTRDLDGLSKGL